MSKTVINGDTPKGGSYGNKDNHRDCGTSGTAFGNCIPAGQKQEEEREVNEFMKNQEVKTTMKKRCPRCGKFILKGETICPDCLEAIGRIIQEEVFPDSEAIVIKPKSTAKRAVNSDELERLFLLGKSPDEMAAHDAPVDYDRKKTITCEDEDGWEEEEDLDDEFDDEDDWEDDYDDDYDDDEPTIAELLKNGVFIGLFVPGGKKKVTINVE